MKYLNRLLVWSRLVNGDDNLSLTNIALMVAIVSLYRHPGTVDLAALMASIAMYQHKKMLKQKDDARVVPLPPPPDPRIDAHAVALAKMQQTVNGLMNSKGMEAAMGRR